MRIENCLGLGTDNVDETSLDIEQQLNQLKAFSFRLGESMDRTAEAMRIRGVSPSAELIADLRSYRDVFVKVQSWLINQQPPSVPSMETSTLLELESGVLNQLTRRRALELLDQVARLIHIDGPQHPISINCQQACQQARLEIQGPAPQSTQTIQALQAGQHPLTVLWKLVSQSETLDDNEWTELLEQCAQQLGKDVATAVARHKLQIQP